MLSSDLGPPAPLPSKRATCTVYTQGVERQRGGSHFARERGWTVEGPKSYDSIETLVLFIQYPLYDLSLTLYFKSPYPVDYQMFALVLCYGQRV